MSKLKEFRSRIPKEVADYLYSYGDIQVEGEVEIITLPTVFIRINGQIFSLARGSYDILTEVKNDE